ncbi:MAG: diguanylate cyclase [Candidatus Korobacteraceae bacterium]
MQPACSEELSSPLPREPRHALGRVLVAEDDPLYRRALQHFLAGKGYGVQLVSDGLQALEIALSPDAPRLLVLDWMMPGLPGPEVCRRLRAAPRDHYQYVLLLTAKHTTADIVEGLEAGADDYLTKPFNVHEFFARMHVGERMIKLHDSLFAAQQALRFQATHDPLTAIWNRGALFELLRAELERAQRKPTSLSLFLVDLDHFKRVNDEFGHLAGDAILREVTQRLSAAVRVYDVVGRYGGEEFIVAAAGLGADRSYQFAERLRHAVSDSPVRTQQAEVTMTISIGVVTANPCGESSVEKLIQSADAALYQAKADGRNRVQAVQL